MLQLRKKHLMKNQKKKSLERKENIMRKRYRSGPHEKEKKNEKKKIQRTVRKRNEKTKKKGKKE